MGDVHCMVVVDRLDSSHAVRTFHQIGDTSPLHATSVGRAVLTHLSRAEVDEVVAGGLKRFGDTTITDPDALRADLAEVRWHGYALNINQYRPGVCAVAAPILDEDGTPLAALAVSLPDSRLDTGRLPELGRQVAAAAQEITSRRLG
ncbi:IclR family transcriptional regulator [Actinomadura rudentiformis]|uniref:IclR family transcriptional regulator n=1 Tax=Actinomadura rudentiformis TaxID=359158 RepID=UPI001CEF7972|nr:IclR family transcriptional regulator C-terminal domain-containing protein [Actinomadura rudentiformis]